SSRLGQDEGSAQAEEVTRRDDGALDGASLRLATDAKARRPFVAATEVERRGNLPGPERFERQNGADHARGLAHVSEGRLGRGHRNLLAMLAEVLDVRARFGQV